MIWSPFVFIALAVATGAQQPPRPGPSAADLADAVWVEGRVTLPEGVPADERVEVVARATGLPIFREFGAPVDERGRFRVAFARDARRGKLSLRAHYLYLDPEVSWRRGEARDEIVLTPTLGACLRGKLMLPEPIAGGCELQLDGTPTTPGRKAIHLNSTIARDMTFECGGLPVDLDWSATLIAGPFVPLVVDGIALAAGQRTNVEWSLKRGATVRGTIVDESGTPVAGARIDVDCRAAPLAPSPLDVRDQRATGADGVFSVRGLAPGNVRIWAERDGWIRVDSEIEGLKDGEVRTGVKVTLRRGVVLSARVLDPAGEPVAGARVRVTQKTEAPHPLVRECVTQDDGTFTCGGLSAKHVDLLVTRESTESAPPKPGDAPAPPKKRKLRASLADVDPAAQDLVVTLKAGLAVEGRVLDDLGRTVSRYTAGAHRADDPDPNAIARTIDVKSRDGAFEIDDLEPGPWNIFVFGRGLVYEPARRIVVPYLGEPLVFVVRRPAVVSGVVLDAARQPASRVLVEVEWERTALLGATRTTEKASVTCAPDGRFEITEVFPGAVRVVATNAEGRKSPTLTLELASGAVRSGVELVLPP